MNQKAQISIITSNNGFLCKEIFVDENGKLSKETHGNLYNGSIETITPSLIELKDIIAGLQNHQALCVGTRKSEFSGISKITTLSKVVAGESIARSKEFIEFNSKPAFMVIDYDEKDLTPHEVQAKLVEMMPEFAGVGMLVAQSSSSGIYLNSNAPPKTIKSGCHIYFIVARGTDIPAIGQLIKHRAWKKGLGHIKISTSGALLERHIFDDAVYSPERLIFEALPILNSGVNQVPRELILFEGGALGEINLTLSEGEIAEHKKLVEIAKSVKKPEAGRVAKAYDTNLIKKYVSEGMPQVRAEQTVLKRRRGILTSDVILRGRVCGLVTVGAILANPEAFLRDSFIDPEETENGTNFRAKVMWCASTATDKTKVLKIRSFAGGETFYTLETAKTTPTERTPIDQPIPDFAEIAPNTELKNKMLVLLNTRQNFELLLKLYGVAVEYDVMRRQKKIYIPDSKSVGDLKNDADISELVNLCNMNKLNPKAVENYLNKLFADNEKNHVLDFIKAQTWDGSDHIRKLFDSIRLAHISDYEYGLSIFTTWLIQCVAAADSAKSTPLKNARPKYENVLVFSSSQGGNKSDFFESLTPEVLRQYFAKGLTLVLDDKDSRFEATSFWIGELGEIDATFKKSEISGLKAFLSLSVDSQRRPYDKVANDYTRRTSFCGSVNDPHFLHDVTGNRRYLPLEILDCNKDHNVDMGQVWGQVWSMYLSGVKWWYDKTDVMYSEVLAHQRGAMKHDQIIEEFIQWYGGDALPDYSRDISYKKYTVKQLIQAVKGDKILPNGTAVECVVTARETDKLRAYLNERGFRCKKSDGVMKFDIMRVYDIREHDKLEQQRKDLKDKQDAALSGVWGDGSPY